MTNGEIEILVYYLLWLYNQQCVLAVTMDNGGWLSVVLVDGELS